MEELEIISSFNPLDALESISKIYNTKQLSKVEVLKIQAQSRNFDRWISEQRNENKEKRNDIIKIIEDYRKHIERIMEMIIQNPDSADVFKDYFEILIKTNNDLALKISEIRIRSK